MRAELTTRMGYELAFRGREMRSSQPRDSPFFKQEGKAASRAGLSRSMIAVDFDQFHNHSGGLVGFDKDIQVRSDRESSRAHLSADEHVEPEPLSLLCGNQRDVLRLVVGAVVETACDRDVELARQVREFRVAFGADDDAIELLDDRRGVEQLMRRQTGKNAAGYVADVVDAGLERTKVHTVELVPDGRNAV